MAQEIVISLEESRVVEAIASVSSSGVTYLIRDDNKWLGSLQGGVVLWIGPSAATECEMLMWSMLLASLGSRR